MGDFFHGWRRKAGCVTLVMTLVFMAGWVRSQTLEDTFHFGADLRECFVGSDNGRFYFNWLHFDGDSSFRYSDTIPFWMVMGRSHEHFTGIDRLPIEWDWSWCGFGYVVEEIGFVAIAPYWSIVIPLTLLSAYLLLSKPRSAKLKSRPTHA